MLQNDEFRSYNAADEYQERTHNLPLRQPDVFLMDEYLHVYQSSLEKTPEVRLVAALFKDGIDSYMRYLFANPRHGEKRLANEAEIWIFSKDEKWPFSFTNVCGILGLAPDFIRGILLRYKQKRTQPNNASEHVERRHFCCRTA